MPYVFQTKDKTGKPHKKWRFQYKDYQGVKRTGTGTSSKRDTVAMAETIEAEHVLIRKGLKEPPKKSDKNLSREFMEVAYEYIAWGKAQGGRGGRPWSDRHAEMRERHLKMWTAKLKLTTLRSFIGIQPKLEKELRTLKEEGKSGKTLTNYAEALKSFGHYCLKRSYLEEDPLKSLGKFDCTPKTERRNFNSEELNALFDVAEYHYRILYLVAVSSGLRANELRSLCVEDLDLEEGGLTLHADWTKNRKAGFQPLPLNVIEELKTFIESGEAKRLYTENYSKTPTLKFPKNPLLHVPTHPTHQLNRHLEDAGIPKHTKKGKIDFHSLRVTYITLILESGASIQYAQNLARHSDPKLTFNVYGKTNDEQIRTLTEATGSIILAQRENKKVVNSCEITTCEVAGPGLEPGTQGFSVLCSTN